jgi:hypothetical protein
MYGIISRGVILIMGITKYYEGDGSWASYGNNNKPWGGRWTLPYHVCGYVEFRPGSHRPRHAREKERGKGVLVACPSWAV